MNEDDFRVQVLKLIDKNPGIYMRQLERLTKEHNIRGATQYHVLMLEGEGKIKVVKYGRYSHYFIEGFDPKKYWINIFKSYPTPETIIHALEGEEWMSAQVIANLISRSKSAIFYHLRRMLDKGVVEMKERHVTQFFRIAKRNHNDSQ